MDKFYGDLVRVVARDGSVWWVKPHLAAVVAASSPLTDCRKVR
jgi:hypothetical protein